MRSIRTKLFGTYFVMSFLTVSVFLIASIWGIRNYYFNSIEANLKNQAEVAREYYNNFLSRAPISANANQLVFYFTRETSQIDILDRYGQVLSSSIKGNQVKELDYSDVTEALRGRASGFIGKHSFTGERISAYTLPVEREGKIEGAIRLSTSLSATDKEIRQITSYLILFGFLLLLVVLMISLFFAHNIVMPIKGITKLAEQMAKGNLGVRSPYAAHKNEIGVLANSLNEMATQIEENEKMKNVFLSSVSHELKTPLTSIKGWAQTLKEPNENSADAEALNIYGMDIIINETDRLSGMVEELLDFSSIQLGSFKLFSEITDINRLVQLVFEQMRPRAESHFFSYQLILPSEQVELYIDPKRIKQVLINILDNAIKFTPQGGAITVSCLLDETDRRSYIIRVEDTGCGIPAEELDLVSKRFYKSSKNKLDNGMGLGLAICNELLILHGGKLTFQSSYGTGTTVTVQLPFQ